MQMAYRNHLLDGGMEQVLKRSGTPFRQPERLAFGLIEPPEHVLQAHKMFISAGADRDGQQLCCGAFPLRHDHRRVLRYPP